MTCNCHRIRRRRFRDELSGIVAGTILIAGIVGAYHLHPIGFIATASLVMIPLYVAAILTREDW